MLWPLALTFPMRTSHCGQGRGSALVPTGETTVVISNPEARMGIIIDETLNSPETKMIG